MAAAWWPPGCCSTARPPGEPSGVHPGESADAGEARSPGPMRPCGMPENAHPRNRAPRPTRRPTCSARSWTTSRSTTTEAGLTRLVGTVRDAVAPARPRGVPGIDQRRVDLHHPGHPDHRHEEHLMITVSHLTKSYGRRTVVDDLSFELAAGRITGFVGPNGAGKSTTMRMMVGLARPDAGEVTYAARAYSDAPRPGPHRSAWSSTPGRCTPVDRLATTCWRWPRSARCPTARVDEVLRPRRARRRRRSAGRAASRSACASASPSPARCSATRRC